MYCSSFHIGKKIDNFAKCATENQGYERRFRRNQSASLTTLDSVTTTATRPWRVLATISWVGVLVCQLAVAITSRNIGKATWWLGPESNPQPIVLWALPFFITVAALVATQRPGRLSVVVHLVCVALLVVVAALDVSGTPGVATVEFVIAFVALLITVVFAAARP
ncbi:MAG: hypothetical protein RLZZ284_390 [Actinomycetota bacterium]|jgi:hypothetical protein